MPPAVPIRVGTAGWSYEDWNSIVYPARPRARLRPARPDGFSLRHQRDQLELLPHPDAAHDGRLGASRRAQSPVRLHRQALPRLHARAQVRRGGPRRPSRRRREPLAQAGRLGSLLAQFPFSFHNSGENRALAGGPPREVLGLSARRRVPARVLGHGGDSRPARPPSRGLRQHRPAAARRQPPADEPRHRAARLLPLPRAQRRANGSAPTRPTSSATTTSTPRKS